MFQSGDDPFKFWFRLDDGRQAAAVRFEMEQGKGILGLRIEGREDPAPVSHYEELDVPIEAVRGGRFLHVLPSGNRRSYGLSQLSLEVVGRVTANRWIELEAVTEHGFRYLRVPDAVVQAAAAPAAVAIAPEAGATAAVKPAGTLPPRQTPVAPSLARDALSRLNHQEAIAYLQSEMAKVEALHQRIAELERRLASSVSREKDLLTVLQRWQQH